MANILISEPAERFVRSWPIADSRARLLDSEMAFLVGAEPASGACPFDSTGNRLVAQYRIFRSTLQTPTSIHV
jgi:hypothetical protein